MGNTNTLAPEFNAPGDDGNTISLSSFKGKIVVLYFYPKDNTPGCTKESCEFAQAYDELKDLGAEVIGVSRDSAQSHQKFRAKYNLPFPLITDASSTVCNQYNVIGEKNMFGKKYQGIVRTTVLIDKNGKIAKTWKKVKVSGHVDEVIKSVRELCKESG